MDNIVPTDLKIDLIKIDVEGAEYLVMDGGKETIKRCKPIVIFEHGLGGADVYDIRPEMVYDLLVGYCGLKISTMKMWLNNTPSFSKEDFAEQFDQGLNYYFIAY